MPFEPLEPGFKGRLFEVDAHDGGTHQDYRHLDLDDRVVLLGNGLRPFSADPLFHQQMVYAVSSLVYAAFKKAPGRHLAWGFEQPDGAERRTRLRLRPYAMLEDNAYYDVSTGELAFGYVRAEPNTMKGQLPRGLVFTSLSHDIIAHGLTHALLDGLRAHSWRRAGAVRCGARGMDTWRRWDGRSRRSTPARADSRVPRNEPGSRRTETPRALIGAPHAAAGHNSAAAPLIAVRRSRHRLDSTRMPRSGRRDHRSTAPTPAAALNLRIRRHQSLHNQAPHLWEAQTPAGKHKRQLACNRRTPAGRRTS